MIPRSLPVFLLILCSAFIVPIFGLAQNPSAISSSTLNADNVRAEVVSNDDEVPDDDANEETAAPDSSDNVVIQDLPPRPDTTGKRAAERFKQTFSFLKDSKDYGKRKFKVSRICLLDNTYLTTIFESKIVLCYTVLVENLKNFPIFFGEIPKQ